MELDVSGYESTDIGFVYEHTDSALNVKPNAEVFSCHLPESVDIALLCDLAESKNANSILFVPSEDDGGLIAFVCEDWSQSPLEIEDISTIDYYCQLVKVSDLREMNGQLDRNVEFEYNDDDGGYYLR